MRTQERQRECRRGLILLWMVERNGGDAADGDVIDAWQLRARRWMVYLLRVDRLLIGRLSSIVSADVRSSVRRSLPGERHASKRTPAAGILVVHVPRPAVGRAVVHERGMEVIGRRVGEEEWNRVARRDAVALASR